MFRTLLVLLLAAPALASSKEPTLACGSAIATVRPIFYRLTKGGRVLYLLGTRHKSVRIQELPDVVLRALGASDLFLSESKSQAGLPGAIHQVVSLAKIFDWRARRITDQLSPEGAEAFRIACAKAEVPFALFNRLRPAAAVALLSSDDGVGEGQSLDGQLVEWAERRRIRTLPLDSLVWKRGVLDAMSYAEYDSYLRATPSDDEAQRLAAYRAGDVAFLEERATGDTVAAPLFFDFVGASRNRAWVRLAVAKHRQYRTLFAAGGVAHLLLPTGLLALFSREGYAIERLDVP